MTKKKNGSVILRSGGLRVGDSLTFASPMCLVVAKIGKDRKFKGAPVIHFKPVPILPTTSGTQFGIRVEDSGVKITR